MSRKSVLFIFQHFSSFVKADFQILQTEYNVKCLNFKPSKGLSKTFLQIFKQFFYLLFNIWKYDIVFVWFADYSSFFPVLFAKLTGKKSVIVIGGYDVCRVKKTNYGAFVSKLRGFFTINSMRFSTINLTVSEHVDRKLKYISPKSKRKLIYNCVNIEKGKSLPAKKNEVLTVAFLDNERTFYLKGIDLFIEVARELPQFKFIIVGLNYSKLSHLLKSIPDNIETHEKIPHHQLNSFYERAKFYCQFSQFESFGVGVAEAISFGCIPLVTNGGALPEIVGDSKYIVKRDSHIIGNMIVELEINHTTNDRQLLHTRINNNFSFDIRKRKLLSALKELKS